MLADILRAIQAEMTTHGYSLASEAFGGVRGMDIPATIMGRAYCIDVSLGASQETMTGAEQTAEVTLYVYLAGCGSSRLTAWAGVMETLREHIWAAISVCPGVAAAQTGRADLAEVQGGNAVLALGFTALYRG